MNALMNLFGIPLGYIMFGCYTLVKNYGIALILFTLITKLVLLPLAIKQQKGMAKMAVFKPKIDEIQKKYANNPEKMQQEMAELYAKENYNPMSGCLPTLIQFPILFGLINVIYYPLKHILHIPTDVVARAFEIASTVLDPSKMNAYSKEMSIITAVQQNSAAFSELGSDFVTKVMEFDFTFLGIDLGAIPQLALDPLVLIPILSGLSSIVLSQISMKMSAATTGEGSMKGMNTTMMLLMPAMSTWIAFQVPAGVGIYWLLSNTLMMVQQWVLYKVYNPAELAEAARKEIEEQRERERKEKIEARKRAKETGETIPVEKALSQKEINRLKLAAARKRDAEKYGEEYVDVTDEDVE